MPPETKTKLISILTPNQVIFDLLNKPGQFRSHPWNEVVSGPSRWHQVYFDHTRNNQVNSDVHTKIPCHFRPVLFCVLHIRVQVPVTPQHYASHICDHHLVFLTCPHDSKTSKVLLKYIYHLKYFTTWCTPGTWLRMILVAGVRQFLSFLYVVFIGVIYRS